jgi:hypothetical protein
LTNVSATAEASQQSRARRRVALTQRRNGLVEQVDPAVIEHSDFKSTWAQRARTSARPVVRANAAAAGGPQAITVVGRRG